MLVEIDLKKVVEFVGQGEDCKVCVDKDGSTYVLPITAAGYSDTILTQEFYAGDYADCESYKAYADWVESCYYGQEFEAGSDEYITFTIKA